jgi:hypothetical protein
MPGLPNGDTSNDVLFWLEAMYEILRMRMSKA